MHLGRINAVGHYRGTFRAWGFFFGLIALIVALLKEENHYQDESQFANPAQGCFSNDEKLKKYKELLEKGEISREEYEYWKQETLNTNC